MGEFVVHRSQNNSLNGTIGLGWRDDADKMKPDRFHHKHVFLNTSKQTIACGVIMIVPPVNSVIIQPSTKRYQDGYQLAKQMGGKIMSNYLMDKLLVSSNGYKKIEIFPTMLGTALAYPATNGVFKNSKAVVDSETGWKIDSKIVEELHETEKAAGKPGIIGVKCIGIYASLENLKYYKNETAAITKKPDVLCAIYKFIQECYKAGKANELGIPVNVSQKLFDKLSGAEKRWFDRLTGAGFRPLLRANFAAEGGRRLISTKFRFNSSYGMPIEISLEKLVEQTGGAVLQVLENAKTTANGLLIVSREASDKIINMVLMKYW